MLDEENCTFSVYQRCVNRRIGISIDIEGSTKHSYLSKMSLHDERPCFVFHDIKIGLAFQCHNSPLTCKTYRISWFGAGIQMNSSSIRQDYGIFTPRGITNSLDLTGFFFGTFFLMLCCNSWLIRQYSFLIFYLNTIYYHIHFFFIHINNATVR